MANTKISDLTAYTTAISTDVLPIVDVTANATKKMTWAKIKSNANLANSIFNVKDYSALGDDSNDDTAEIQAAIDAAAAAGSGIVLFPQGIYKISATLQLKSGVTLQGAGARVGGTTIKQYSTTAAALTAANSTGVELTNISIRDFHIMGPGATSGNGIYFSCASDYPPHDYYQLENLLITDFLGSGKYAINIESIILSSLTNVNMQECANGIFFNGGDYATISTSTVLNNCYANAIAGKGFHVYRSNYITFNSCAADDVGTAYYMDEALGITFNSCGAEWATSVSPNTGWHTVNSSLGVVLNGCYTYANRGYSISAAADTTVNVTGFVEDSPSSATASILIGAGANVIQSNSYLATAVSVNATGIYKTPGTSRVKTAASYTTDTGTSINCGSQDNFIVTAQTGALKFNNPSGNPENGQALVITVASNTTSARALTWDTDYEASTVALPSTTAATTAQLNIGFKYSAGRSKWVCVAVA
jgi:hypothetical protein